MRLLLLLLLAPIALSAQDDILVGVTLKADYGRYTMNDPDINDFYTSYNQFYSNVMVRPFDTLSMREFSHPAYGMGIRVASGKAFGPSAGLFLTRGTTRHTEQAEFQNGIISQTDFLVKDVVCQVDAGFHAGQVLYLHGHIAGHFRTTIMDFGYFYQDGSYSIGNEYDVLGVFHGWTTTLDVGANAMLRLGRVMIPVGISFPTNFASDGGLLSFTDYDITRIRWNDLPRDFETWANDPASLDLEEGFVRMESFRSVRLNVGVEIFLGKK